jgi:hypothetical protein
MAAQSNNDLRCSAACLQTVAVEETPNPDVELRADPALSDRYKALVERAETTNTALDVTRFMFVEAPASLMKDLANLVPVGGSLAQDLIDDAIDALEKHEAKKVALTLRAGLKQIEADGLSDFNNSDPEGRFRRVESALRKLRVLANDEGLFDHATDPEVKTELQQSAIRMLTEGLTELKREVVINTSQLRTVKGELRTLRGQVDTLQASVKELKQGQNAINKHAATAAAQTESTPEFKRAQEKAVKAYVQNAKVAAGQFQAAAGILAEVGAPEAAQMANFASGAIELGAGIAMSMVNPTAILPTVLNGMKFLKGLGGGASPDPVQAALAEVMKMQAKIFKKLEEIEHTIKMNHIEVMNAVAATNHNVLLNTSWLRQDSVVRLQTCTQLIRPSAVSENPQRGTVVRFDRSVRFPSYTTFVEHASQFPVSVSSCKQALVEHFQRLDGDTPIHLVFQLSKAQFTTSLDAPTGLEASLPQFVEAYKARIVSRNLRFLALIDAQHWMSPAADAITIDDVARAVSKPSRTVPPAHAANVAMVLPSPLNALSIAKYGSWLAGTHFYFELTDQAGTPLKREAIIKRKTVPQNGRAALRWASAIADAAVIQKSLEQGGLLLPFVYYAWQNASNDDLVCGKWPGASLLRNRAQLCDASSGKPTAEGQKIALELRDLLLGKAAAQGPDDGGLVRSNPLLARNAVLFGVHQRLRAVQSHRLAYRIAINTPSSSRLLHKLLGDEWKLEFSDKEDAKAGLKVGWFTRINGTPVMMPDASLVEKGTLAMDPDFLSLQDARRRVSEELAGYDLVDGLNQPDLAIMHRMMAAGLTIDRATSDETTSTPTNKNK